MTCLRNVGALLLAGFAAVVSVGAVQHPRDASAVLIPLSASDSHGNVLGLEPADFTVLDDGMPRSTTLVSWPGIRAIVLFDSSASMTTLDRLYGRDTYLEFLRSGVEQLAGTLLPNESVRVGSIGDRIMIARDYVHDPPSLNAALLAVFQWQGTSPIWDAIDETVVAGGDLPSRPVSVIVTDGRANSDEKTFAEVERHFMKSNVAVFTIGVHGEFTYKKNATAPDVRHGPLERPVQLAENTGGWYVPIRTPDEIGKALVQVFRRAREQYLLSFVPAETDGKVHVLGVRAQRQGVNVSARQAYVR